MNRYSPDDVTVLVPFLEGGREDWLEQALASFPGCRYMVCRNTGGLADALNQALAQTTTEFVLPFGADDVASPGFAETLTAWAHDADVVYPSMKLVDESLRRDLGDFPASPFCPVRLQTWNMVPGAFLGRTETLRAAGGWRNLESLEDWDLHVRMFRAGATFKACPDALMYYRQVPGSRNRSSAKTKAEWKRLIVGEPPKAKATWYAQATAATAYWRCQVPARLLPGMVTTDLTGEQQPDGTIGYSDHQGAAIFQFPGSSDRAASILNMQAANIKTLVEVDDNYLDDTDVNVQRRAGWQQRIGQGPHTSQGHRFCVKHADGVIVTTAALADIYADVNDNVFVCPNQIDKNDWPDPQEPDGNVFRVGWFASFSHDKDARLVRRALSWASRQPGVEVVTMGYDPPGWDFTRTHLSWSNDMSVYRRLLSLLDVGVAPVARTGWSVCRSDLKALELGMAQALPVLSTVPPYAGWEHLPALTAGDEREFEERIRWCVRNQDDARALARKTREHVLSERLIEHHIEDWETAVAC